MLIIKHQKKCSKKHCKKIEADGLDEVLYNINNNKELQRKLRLFEENKAKYDKLPLIYF